MISFISYHIKLDILSTSNITRKDYARCFISHICVSALLESSSSDITLYFSLELITKKV